MSLVPVGRERDTDGVADPPRVLFLTTLVSRMAAWITALDGRALPAAVVEKLRLAVLDTLAAMLSGVHEEITRHAVGTLVDGSGGGEATVIGHRLRTGLGPAALANGIMGHACDYDDNSWTLWGHPTAPALPAVLAAAERRRLSGLDVLTALAAALEVEKALGIGCQPLHYSIGWHPTATLGVFGATAGAAKALGLDHDRVQMALGIAASRSAGLRLNSGTMTKALHVGFAARDGLEAAFLAGAGATSNPRVLDAPRGFFDAYAPGHGPVAGIAESLGNPYEVVDPGLSPKLYPSCGETHAGVDAILELRVEHGLEPDTVKRIRCGITPFALENLPHRNPQTPLQCKFSAHYCMATALVKGRLGMAEFDPEAIDNTRVRDVMARTEVFVHPELSGDAAATFSTPAFVELETNDGRTLEKRVIEMRGHPANPVTAAELEAKFVECGERVLDNAQVRRALALIEDMENLTDIGALLRELVPA